MKRTRVLIPKGQIEGRISDLAAEIRRDYRGKHPLFLGVLKGSFVFMADLVRVLNMPLEVEFVRLSSYGSGTETSGRVKMAGGLGVDIRGRDVLVVEDIVDTGITLSFLLDYLRNQGPASLKLCALLDKPSRRKVPLRIDYLGFTVENVFIVGYGIDWNEQYRYLADVCCVEEV